MTKILIAVVSTLALAAAPQSMAASKSGNGIQVSKGSTGGNSGVGARNADGIAAVRRLPGLRKFTNITLKRGITAKQD